MLTTPTLKQINNQSTTYIKFEYTINIVEDFDDNNYHVNLTRNFIHWSNQTSTSILN